MGYIKINQSQWDKKTANRYKSVFYDVVMFIKENSISWNYGLWEVLHALIKSGLTLTDVQEYDYSPCNYF
ncbi:hypothetical protein SAMN06265379_101268 [Saccharicrinis carchari]|uniref:Uncharacterized protein n=1 Tax=Saccharicrinis carchari TaxID=1168039 RepID=A0A521AMV1_SACCC|nr:hypothetical protein [Saccharicrinis carchari]SMO36136.1 hypothetical protein SAMN06265379_101268 [Saccharicrinis carchari]